MPTSRATAASVATEVARALRRLGDPRRAAGEKRYLKSGLTFYGVTKPQLRAALSAMLHTHEPLGRRSMLALVRALWATPIHEHRAAAIDLLDRHVALLQPADLALVERLIRESRTWAFVDWMAVPVVGAMVDRHPTLTRTLDRWAHDDDFWVRRSALLALLGPLRRGEGDFPRFSRYADAMLDEREFFIRKAIGWVLREVGKTRPRLVSDWLLPRVGRASGVTVREAVKYLPAPQRSRILARRKASRAGSPRPQASA